MIAATLRTRRLTLLPATADHLRAELDGRAAFAALLGASVPPSWPPGEYDEEAQRFFLDRLSEAGPDATGWYGWYALRPADALAPAALVAGGGYHGPPAADGVVELGYSVCPEWRGRGYASELADALARHAAGQAGVARVIAHTTPDNPASIRVLERSGFALVGPGCEPGSLRFQYRTARPERAPLPPPAEVTCNPIPDPPSASGS